MCDPLDPAMYRGAFSYPSTSLDAQAMGLKKVLEKRKYIFHKKEHEISNSYYTDALLQLIALLNMVCTSFIKYHEAYTFIQPLFLK